MTVEEFANKVADQIEYHFNRWQESAERKRFEDDGPLTKEELDQANGIATGLSIAQHVVQKCLKEATAAPTTARGE